MGASASYGANTAFTVTDPGYFLLTASGSYAGMASNCNPVSCAPLSSLAAGLSGMFSGGAGITDSDDNSLGNVDLSGNSNSAYTAGLTPGDYEASLNLTDNGSDLIYLADGTYTLSLGWQDSNTSIHGDFSSAIDASLVPTTYPTPEPNAFLLLIAAGIGCLLRARRKNAEKWYR
jgi:hypothetical protein